MLTGIRESNVTRVRKWKPEHLTTSPRPACDSSSSPRNSRRWSFNPSSSLSCRLSRLGCMRSQELLSDLFGRYSVFTASRDGRLPLLQSGEGFLSANDEIGLESMISVSVGGPLRVVRKELVLQSCIPRIGFPCCQRYITKKGYDPDMIRSCPSCFLSMADSP
jgi:hypothetical protein